MVTNEISAAARATNAPAPVLSGEASSELGDRFSELLRQLVGDADVTASFGGAANLGIIQVQAAAVKEREAEIVKPEPEEQVEDAVVQSEDDSEKQVASEEEDDSEKAAAEEVQVVAVPVQLAQTVTETTEELAPEEVVAEVVAQEVVAQGLEKDAVADKDLPFELQKAVAAQNAAQANVKKEGAEQGNVQTVQQAAVTAEPVTQSNQKNAVRQAEKSPHEDYARLQRILEGAASEEAVEPAPEQAQFLEAAKPAAPAPKESLMREAIAQQGVMTRLGAEAEQAGARSSGKGSSAAGGVDAFSLGAQRGALEKLTAGKGKAQAALTSKDAQKVVDQLKELLQKAIQVRDGNSISVRLNPAELGQMTVKVTQRDSQVYARIIPESPEVEAALRTRAAEVTQVLVAAGLKADQVLVSIGRERTEGESLQFQQFMGQGSNGFHESKEQAQGGGSEQDAFLGNASYAAEDQVADAGWIA